MKFYEDIVQPIGFRFNSERAHAVARWGLRTIAKHDRVMNAIGSRYILRDPSLRTVIHSDYGDTEYMNPLGFAAGFVKTWPEAWALQRFGFGGLSEFGTITPKPQTGNSERPRIQRVSSVGAVWNALGFPNPGAEHVASTMYELRGNLPIGVNIGVGHDTPLDEAWRDYRFVAEVLWNYVDHITINLSSPNTTGLRSLQRADHLDKILHWMQVERGIQMTEVLIGIKVSPDETDETYSDIIQVCRKWRVDYIVIGNTTTFRKEKWNVPAHGGISGLPLASRARELCRRFFKELQGEISIISVGGIWTGWMLYDRIRSGANMCQILTKLFYGGPGCPREMLQELVMYLDADGFSSVQEAVGVDVP